MKLKVLATFIFALAFSNNLKANHGIGAEISYRALDTFKFEVTYVFYRECGTSFSTAVPATCYVSCASANRLRIFPTLTEVKNIIPYHDTVTTGCPTNYVAGSTFGLEKLVFKDTVNFNGTVYTALKNCCDITFEAVAFPRTPSHNTGLATQLLYNYAYLNLCKANDNSSPELSFDDLSYLCCNQPAYMSFNSVDTIDDDSLSYSWDQPLRAYGNAVNYSGIGYYAYNHPFQAYYPGTLSPPYSAPYGITPIGVYLDPQTGELILTPTRCSEITAAVVRITEWRKDSSGTYEEIGFNRVERMYVTTTCPGNNPPGIFTRRVQYACVGTQLCFQIVTWDEKFVPPPPASPPPADTTSIKWNHLIPGSSCTILSDTAREKTAEFCWTASSDDLRSRPYYFTAQVRDNNSPINALNYLTVRIEVNDVWEPSVSIDSQACAWYKLNPQYDSAEHPNTIFEWAILDSAGNRLYEEVEFASNGNNLSRNKIDSVKFKYAGTYIVRLLLSDPDACNKYVYDTIFISNPSRIDLSLGDLSVCKGYANIISATSKFGSGPYQYQWYVDGNISADDTLNNYYVSLDSANESYKYTIVSTDDSGCTETASSVINSFSENFPDFADSIVSCSDSLRLSVSSEYQSVNWSTGSQDTSIIVTISDLYYIGILDSNSCEYQDYFYVYLVPEPSSNIGDTFLCHGSTLTLDGGDYAEYNWSTGSNLRTIDLSDSAFIKLDLVDQYGCTGSDSFRVEVKDNPTLSIRDTFVCQSDIELSINAAMIVQPQVLSTFELQATCISCNGNDISDIFIDKGNRDYYLKVDENTYSMKNAIVDSLQLQLTLIDSNGCSASSQTEILIYAYPPAPVLTRNGSVISSSYPSVLWYRNDTLLEFRVSDTLITDELGAYTARAYSHESCVLSEVSNSIDNTVGINELSQLGWRLYPNPSNGMLRIDAPHAIEIDIKALLYNELGQEIPIELMRDGTSLYLQYEAPTGVYILHITIDGNIYYERIINE